MILKNGKRIDGCTDTLPVGTVQPFLGLTPPLGYLVCQGQLISKKEYPELYNICKSTFGTETETHFYLPDLRGKTIIGYDPNDNLFNVIGKILGSRTHTHTSAEHAHDIDGHTHTSAAHTHTVAGHTHTSAAHTHTTGNHTLTVAEIPAHSHAMYGGANTGGSYEGTDSFASGFSTFRKIEQGTYDTGGGGAHNHGNTGSTTPGNTGSTSLTTNSATPGDTGSTNLITRNATPGNTGESDNFQPSITMNWIVKAAMLIPHYFVVENTLTSTNTSNALSAAQGKILNGKIDNIKIDINKIVQNNISSSFSNFTDTKNYNTITGYNSIIVKNGWCTVRCYLNVESPTTEQIPLLDVPVPLITDKGYPHWEFHNWETAPSGMPLIVVITDDGKLNLRRGVAGVKYFVNITYPVAE